MFSDSEDISDFGSNENKNNTTTNRFCCCTPPWQENKDNDNPQQTFGMISTPESQPAVPNSVRHSEECEFKMLEEVKCDKLEMENDGESGGEKRICIYCINTNCETSTACKCTGSQKLEEKVESENESESEERICRYCFDGDGDLITPCKCIGSQKWVHKECLRKWQRMCQVRKSTHPWYREKNNSESVCYVCSSKFELEPPKYNELVAGMTGEQIVSRVKEGFLIVATIESSEQSRAILQANGHIERIRNHLTPWIGGVYLIINISSGRNDDIITAVNLTQELTRPRSNLVSHVRRFVGNKNVVIRYMDCGPCDGLHGVGCLHATSAEYVERETNLRVMDDMLNGVTIAGDLASVVRISHEDWERESSCREQQNLKRLPMPTPPSRLVYACYGDGTWTRSQLIGEIARGSWGMAVYKSADVFKVPNEQHPPSPSELYMKLHNEDRPIEPGENEMSRDFDEALDPRPFEDTEEARRHREHLRAQLLANSNRSSKTTPSTPEDEESKSMELFTNDSAIEEDVKTDFSSTIEIEPQVYPTYRGVEL